MISKQDNAHSELQEELRQRAGELDEDWAADYQNETPSQRPTKPEWMEERAARALDDQKALISELVEALKIARVHVGMAAEEYTDESERIFDDIKQIDAALSKAKEQADE